MTFVTRFALGVAFAALLSLGVTGNARAAKAAAASPAKASAAAPEFPPGTFTDGGHYKLTDFQGKAVVLFFYEQECPRCRGLIPERNKVVEQFKDQPVKFIAVGAGDSLTDASSYVKGTKLEMPSFADDLGVMEHRYGFHISLQNIYQFRIIGPTGSVVGMSMEPADIEKALKSVKWKYKDGGYDAKLNPIIDLLEWNQYEAAVRQLRPLTKGKAPVNASAAKLYDAVKAEGQAWLDEADAAAKSEDMVKAFDLYTKVSTAFAGDELAKPADAALKTVRKSKTVVDELAARQMYAGLDLAMSKATPKQRPDVIGYCESIGKKYPTSPTGKKATELAGELAKAGEAAKS